MHYKLKSGEDPFELNPGLLAIAQYKALTARQMFFVCLVADTDWDNPLKTLPARQRREKAALIVGFPMEAGGKRLDKNGRQLVNGQIEDVEAAIKFYQSVQFDEDQANLEAVNKQIEEARALMSKDKEKLAGSDKKLMFDLAEKAVKLGKGINDLVETRDSIVARIKAKKPINLEIVTGTSADLPDLDLDKMDEDNGESLSDMIVNRQHQLKETND